MQKKFNYDYSEEELRAWCDSYLQPMAARAERGILLFNNHVRAMAPRNGRKLAVILAGLRHGER
jgi:uncharacterized protein YecE (DUF72 family)